MKNVFEQVLQQLHVPYTKKYARNIYLQHPDRNNLWGISDLLALYDISNVSISMSDKEDIDRLSSAIPCRVFSGFGACYAVQF